MHNATLNNKQQTVNISIFSQYIKTNHLDIINKTIKNFVMPFQTALCSASKFLLIVIFMDPVRAYIHRWYCWCFCHVIGYIENNNNDLDLNQYLISCGTQNYHKVPVIVPVIFLQQTGYIEYKLIKITNSSKINVHNNLMYPYNAYW